MINRLTAHFHFNNKTFLAHGYDCILIFYKSASYFPTALYIIFSIIIIICFNCIFYNWKNIFNTPLNAPTHQHKVVLWLHLISQHPLCGSGKKRIRVQAGFLQACKLQHSSSWFIESRLSLSPPCVFWRPPELWPLHPWPSYLSPWALSSLSL